MAYDLAHLEPLIALLSQWISQRWIADALGLSEGYVRKILRRLRQTGYAHSDFFGASAPRLRWARPRAQKVRRPRTER